MNILVTGGAGYIGSHTCKLLAAHGYSPIVLDNLLYGHAWACQWGPLEKGDLADPAFIGKVFKAHSVDAVIHFAALTYVGESVTDPARYYRNNVVGTLNLLDTMREHVVDKIVFSSTCATYGNPQTETLEETHPQDPINPYGESKYFVERILRAYDKAYSLRSACLRYFNASGADPDGAIGEDHSPETHLIPLVIDAALGRRPNIQIFGTDYPTPDGTAIRDYIHVMDLADAHVKALSHLCNQKRSIAVNLGTGIGNSVREVIHAVEKVSGRKVPVVEKPRREGDPPKLVAKNAYAKELLGWTPRYKRLPETVQHAWNWHSKHQASR